MKRSTSLFFVTIFILSLLFSGISPTPTQAAGTISLTTLGTAYNQDFNTLAATGTTNTIIPTGWEFYEFGTNADTTYRAGTGSDNTGDTYSFGPASNTDRAFGGLLSGSLTPMIGAQFTNNTGGTITSLQIAYTGEQWRLGQNTTGRAADRLDFQLSINASTLNTGTWIDYDALDFTSPVISGTNGAINGNVSPNRTTLSFIISGLSISNGASFWIRWVDFNLAPGSDDGLAVDDFSLISNGLAADLPPSVVSTTPTTGETNFPIDDNLSIVFSEPVNFSAASYSLACNSTPIASTFIGGPTTFTIDPTSDLTNGQSCTLTIYAANVSDQDANDPPDLMTSDYVVNFTPYDVCAQAYTSIPSIQGSGSNAAITGSVTTQGVVVGDYEGPSPTLRGFYLQDMSGDGNPTTSDGIFVYNASYNNVNVGEVVRVTGTAGEYQGQTQINTTAKPVNCGNGSIAPVEITLPLPSADYLEQFEGMLVQFPQTLYVTEHFQLGRFGQVVLSSGGRLQQPTNIVEPGPAADALQIANNLNRIIVDDELNNQNRDPILFGRGGLPLSASNTLRGGDTATGVVGVMTYTWSGNSASGNAYRVRPVNSLGGTINFEPENPRPVAAPDVGGEIKVIGMNLLNYFNTFTGCTLGVGGTVTDCRGAESLVEFDRQWPKTVAAILKMDAAVVGLIELENDGYGPDSAIQHLVDQINALTFPGNYALLDVDANTGQTNALGTDAIKVGLIYKPSVVTPVGQTAALNNEAFVNAGDAVARNRPALAQAFRQNSDSAVFVVSVNHLKSKGSTCDGEEEPFMPGLQGYCNNVRTMGAGILAAWLSSDPTGTGDPDVLILGI